MLKNSHWCFITLKMKPKVLHWPTNGQTTIYCSNLISSHPMPIPTTLASWMFFKTSPGSFLSILIFVAPSTWKTLFKTFHIAHSSTASKLSHMLPLQRSLLTQMLQETNHHPTPRTTLSSLSLSIYHGFLVAQLILNILAVFGKLQDFPSGK